MEILKSFLLSENIQFQANVDLKEKTWIKRGGVANYWIQPTNLIHLEKLVIFCQKNSIPFDIIGSTSNIYFRNSYNPLLVVSTVKLRERTYQENQIECECGVAISKLAHECNKKGIAGFSGFLGLPGTVAGATVNNAGCYGSLSSEVVNSVDMIIDGEIRTLTNDELKFSHRNSAIKSGIITGVVSKVRYRSDLKDDSEVLMKKSKDDLKYRRTHYEYTHPNLGTTYCKMHFKKLPFIKRVFYKLIWYYLNVFVKDSSKRKRIDTAVQIALRNGNYIKEYISEFGIQCFVWKDENADAAFSDYCKFIESNTSESTLEIEVKG